MGGCGNTRLESRCSWDKGEVITCKIKAGGMEVFHKGLFLGLIENRDWRQDRSLGKEQGKVKREETSFETNSAGWEKSRCHQMGVGQSRTWTGG